MQIKEIIRITKGRLVSGDRRADIDPAAISTDSRTLKRGEFFLPLKGGNFDGENFIEEAFSKGAIGAFTTDRGSRISDRGQIIIRVKNTTDALQKIAHAHRMKFALPVIGVTGSNGKTTVKDMIAKVLSPRFNVLKNEGTKNNRIGVPQTLLKLNSSHSACVIEMGANHKGEIRLLAGIARPNTAVITNVGPSHLEFFKDLKGVFEAKREIFEFLGKEGLAILNGDDDHLSMIRGSIFRIRRFGFDDKNDFRASRVSVEGSRIKFYLNDRSPFVLNVLGVHNIYNALAAIAVASHFALSYESIKRILSECAPGPMRLNVKDIGGVFVIDDAYNSNPLSMKCALDAVQRYPARARWIVSADMLELGQREEDFHKAAGEAIARSRIDGLLTFGSLSRHTSSAALECGMLKDRVWHCSTREEVAKVLRNIAKAGDVVLVKGSRAMKMEEVIEKLKGQG